MIVDYSGLTMVDNDENHGYLVGGWPTPLKNDGVKVSWDDDVPNILLGMIWKKKTDFETAIQGPESLSRALCLSTTGSSDPFFRETHDLPNLQKVVLPSVRTIIHGDFVK